MAAMEAESTAATRLVVHSAGNKYVGKLNITETMRRSTRVQPPQRVIIMDNSGSMGQWSKRMVNTVFPIFLQRLGAKEDEPLLLILFSDRSSSHHIKVGSLSQFPMPGQGGTKMQGVFHELQSQLDPSNPCVQLLALSDGQVMDQEYTADAAASVASQLDTFQIEARAVRLSTSLHGQPDTRALASVLQLNTGKPSTLVDLQTSVGKEQVRDADLAADMANMFESSGFNLHTLKGSSATLQLEPWSEPKAEIMLRQGMNTFWMTSCPEIALSLNDEPLEMVEGTSVSPSTMGTILEDRLEFFVSKLKVLKVIDTQQAKDQIDQIVYFFKEFEASLKPDDDLAPLLAGGGLKNRALFMRRNLQRRMRSVTTLLENIANDDRVRALNQLQQADYLRTMDGTKNAKALAKRAQTSGTEFDATL